MDKENLVLVGGVIAVVVLLLILSTGGNIPFIGEDIGLQSLDSTDKFNEEFLTLESATDNIRNDVWKWIVRGGNYVDVLTDDNKETYVTTIIVNKEDCFLKVSGISDAWKEGKIFRIELINSYVPWGEDVGRVAGAIKIGGSIHRTNYEKVPGGYSWQYHSYTGSEKTYTYKFDKNPISNKEWKWTDLNDMEVGISFKETSYMMSTEGTPACTEVKLKIYFGQEVKISTTNGADVNVKGVGTKTATNGKTIFKLPLNTQYNVEISKNYYYTETGQIITTEDSYDFPLERSHYKLDIASSPSDANIQGEGWYPKGETATYSVSKDHYQTKQGTVVLDKDKTINVDLVRSEYLIKVNQQPSDAKVTINGQRTSQKWVSANSNCNIKVSKDRYRTETEQFVAGSDRTLDVTLEQILFTLKVNTNPVGAQIEIPSSSMVKQGDATFENLEEGTYFLEISKQFFETEKQTVHLNSDKTIDVTLDPSHYKIEVITNPSTAEVTINGQPFEEGMYEKGETYKIKANAQYYYEETESFILNEDTSVELNLRPSHVDVEIITSPPDCEVTISEVEPELRPQSMKDTKKLVPGTYEITISKTGYITKTETIKIEEDTTLHFALNQEETVYNPYSEKDTPGFELMAVIIAIGIALIILKKRRN